MTDFLYTHSIHDVPYTEWIRMTPAEREEAAPGHTKGPPVVAKLVPVDPQTQLVATTRGSRAAQILQWAKGLEVTMANVEEVSSQLTIVMQESKAVDTELKAITKPQNDALKAVRAFFAPATKAYEEAEKLVKQKISGARQAQIAVNMQATQQAAQLLAQGDSRGAALAANVIENTALPSNLSARPALKFEIVDESAVPHSLCSPDPNKIKHWVALYGETHPCPGVRVWRDEILSVRTGG